MKTRRKLWTLAAIAGAVAAILAAADEPAPMAAPPAPVAGEVEWARWIADRIGGQVEHQTFSQRRVDVLTPDLAIEIEWCDRAKAAEACEQAVYYATATGRRPAIVLLVGRRGYPVERVDFDWIVGQAARAGVKAVAVLDVRNPDIAAAVEHLGGVE